jgi:hypothetical protein
MHVIPSRAIVVSLHPPEDPVELSIRNLCGGKPTSRCVVEVAQLQGGCIARRQARRLGFSGRVIDRWIVKSWLIPIHRGVYAVGHIPRTHEERWWGSVLACGKDAKASAGTSAAAHALLRPHPRVHVTTPSKRWRPGVANHTADTDTVWIDGLPCTTVARTLLDLAGCVPVGVLESAVRQAQIRGVLDLRALAELTLAFPRARGVRRLRTILGDPVLLAPTRSKPERVALRALVEDGWEWPDVGECVHGEELDLSWPASRLGLEIDGPTHLTPVQRARDARRDAKLAAQGWRIVRVPDTDAAQAPAALRRVVASPPQRWQTDDSTGGGATAMRRGGAAA